MKLMLKGATNNLLSAIKELQSDLNFELAEDGIPILIKQADKGLSVSLKNGQGEIVYDKKAAFFRGLGLLLENYARSKTFHIEEDAQFETIGPMFDLSRNAVMKPERFEDMLRKLALMGFNSAMLYMEDVYEIESQPYFGYMRGRYSLDQLNQLDDYAHQFGIELIPCIQTLAHLEEFLKWSDASGLKDTRGVLLVESEATYTFVRDMIESVTKPFRSKRIHIGMDEAEELGRGVYLNKFGHKDRLELMTGHLNRVLEIVDENGLMPMMWSDMFMKLASKTGDAHYDLMTEIPDEIIEATPKNVTLMYWDYAHTKKEEYLAMMKKHKAFGRKPAFAGGIWVWNTFATNYGLSLGASDAALQACKQEGIQDVFVTLWGDDGYENNYFSAMLGLQLYAEHAYARTLDRSKLHDRVKFCTGIDAETYLLLNELDAIPGVDPNNKEQTNPSKFLLWQDVLLGLFDKHVEGLDLYSHYKALANKIRVSRDGNNALDYIFDVPEKLAELLSVKATIGVQLKAAYDRGDNKELKHIADQVLPEIIDKAEVLRLAHRKQWLHMHKPFGWEVIDIRYGGLKSRLETAIYRINEYVSGEIDFIDELEQKRLYYHDIENSTGLGWSSYYYRMASPNVFFHVLPI
ncbi:beta-N-acetylhexosaminidase [Virgibacillus sp. AGTR]|uniref:beta-N-acetylhexosaminidase n=1 Tax=Virgibacillus sp. AGTR TaxID=2812055 RepID=UPI001964ACD3|nr:beta-N-acetylhexosaminidase [Virgibacillus sp. AGTR]MCC2248590.1 beta-N-acetylhexosaminidase [Virgibacillus sp. AGTR]QRZ18347.1 beta-N-acetylhexosaminidase [Virgibacillus sp. AGTR]